MSLIPPGRYATRIATLGLLFALASLLCTCGPAPFSLLVSRHYVEYASQPLGIDAVHPRLGWAIESERPGTYQAAYHVQVASSQGALEDGLADRWDSGWVESDNSVHVAYAGRPLNARDRCYWRVRIRDRDGQESPWSTPAYWTMGLLSEQDWRAEWISHKYAAVSTLRTPFASEPQEFDDSDSLATYFQRKVSLSSDIVSATATVSGLGYYELYLNGQKVGDHVLDPAFTDYQRTVHYQTYEVTDLLRAGRENTVGAILGGGFYNLPTQDLFQINRANWKTPNKLLLNLEIEYADGNKAYVVTDSSWQWRYGPLVYNSLRGGETIDLRREAEPWQPVTVVPPPVGELRAQVIPPMRVNDTLRAAAMWSPEPGVYVYDFGENMTGWARAQVQGGMEKTIQFDFNEVLHPDSTVNVDHSAGHTWGRFQRGYLIGGAGAEVVYEPRFTYHGFRYVQLSGLDYRPELDDVVAMRVFTDLETAGTFNCSNPRLNELHAAVRRTLENSIHGMPGEEATREKMGWTLDGGMETMESYFLNYRSTNAYRKYLQDMIDAQEEDGHIPPIIPTNGWGFNTGEEPFAWDDPWWGGTIYYVVQKLYQYTGDTAIIAHAYQPMVRYLEYLETTAEDDILSWALGDWLDLTHGQNGFGPGLTPVPVTATAGYAHFNRQLAEFARRIGKTVEAAAYDRAADRIRDRFNEEFLSEEGWYAHNSQTAQAMALHYDLAPDDRREQVFDRLLQAIAENDEHTSVGFLGVKPLLYTLSEEGYLPLAYRMVTQEESPGWLHYVADERSTMGENLNAAGYGTGHHPFSTNIGFWLYAYLAGIQPFTGPAGLDTIDLKPGWATPLEWVEASHVTPKGPVHISWRRLSARRVSCRISIPPNMTGRLFPGPGAQVRELPPGEHTLEFAN